MPQKYILKLVVKDTNKFTKCWQLRCICWRNVWIVDCSSSSNSPTTEILLSQSVDTLEFKATLQWPGTEFHPIVMMCSYISFYKRSWIRQEISGKVSKTHFRHCFFLKAGMKLLKTIDALNHFFLLLWLLIYWGQGNSFSYSFSFCS